MSWFGPAAILGECPRWDTGTQTLSWVDIDGGTLHQARPAADGWASTSRRLAPPLAGAVLLDGGDAAQRWLLAMDRSLTEWTSAAGPGASTPVESGSPACPVRLNEMVTDPLGRIWVGSMAYDWTAGAGSFFRIDLDGSVHRVLGDITIANGIGWSPDATTMYTTDTGPGQITAWAYDLDRGTVSRPQPLVVAEAGAGRPDGLAVDTDGNVWSAFAGGSCVRCFTAEGVELERLTVPAPNPTSCCFAGPKLDRLVVTTGRKRLSADMLSANPDSGRVWDAGAIGARGLPQPRARVRLAAASEQLHAS